MNCFESRSNGPYKLPHTACRISILCIYIKTYIWCQMYQNGNLKWIFCLPLFVSLNHLICWWFLHTISPSTDQNPTPNTALVEDSLFAKYSKCCQTFPGWTIHLAAIPLDAKHYKRFFLKLSSGVNFRCVWRYNDAKINCQFFLLHFCSYNLCVCVFFFLFRFIIRLQSHEHDYNCLQINWNW